MSAQQPCGKTKKERGALNVRVWFPDRHSASSAQVVCAPASHSLWSLSVQLLKNWSISRKLALLVAVPLVGLGAFAITSFDTVSRVKVTGPLYANIVQNKDLIADILPPPAYIVEAHLVSLQMANASNLEEVHKYAARQEQLRKDYNTRIEFWTTDLAQSEMKDTFLNASQDPAQAYFKVLNEEYIPALLREDAEVALGVLNTKLAPLFEEHRTQIDKVVVSATAKAAADEKTAASTLAMRATMLWSVAGAAALFTIALGFTIARGVTGPVRRIAQSLEAIATGKAQLKATLEADRKDELGVLSSAANKLITKLADFMKNTKTASEQVMRSAGELQEHAASTNDNIERMSTRCREVASAMTEMSASASEVADQARHANKAAESAREVATQGGETVRGTVVEMKNAEAAVGASTQNVAVLKERSEAIGRMIEMINDIADQTTLLALNAAIEAARAGEHGRGFAVVADEVRKLADRTAKTTSEVRESITQIQHETGTVANAMNSSATLVRQGSGAATKAGEQLASIVKASEQVTSMIGTIAHAASEQSTTTQQVSQALEEIAAITDATQRSTHESQGAIESLATRSAELSKLIESSGLKL
jgi:methyl-accepting chemotaxis protein